MKAYEISIRNSSGNIIFMELEASSKKEAVKIVNKLFRKETFRIIRIKEL